MLQRKNAKRPYGEWMEVVVALIKKGANFNRYINNSETVLEFLLQFSGSPELLDAVLHSPKLKKNDNAALMVCLAAAHGRADLAALGYEEISLRGQVPQVTRVPQPVLTTRSVQSELTESLLEAGLVVKKGYGVK